MDEIISKLRRADMETGKGKKVSKVCKELDITEQTYYCWRQKVWRDAVGDGQAVEGSREGECEAEEVGRQQAIREKQEREFFMRQISNRPISQRNGRLRTCPTSIT